jgi:hypothetical protein
MTGALLWVLFVTKHGLMAHVIDFGYSQGRSNATGWWPLGLLGSLLAELAVSVLLISELAHFCCSAWILLEAVGLVGSCLVERRAPVTRLLSTHVRCEAVMLVVYALIALNAVV